MNKILSFLLISIFANSTFIIVSLFAQHPKSNGDDRKIEFPDIPGYLTLKCDFHQHTVFSDGHVWPSIRVGEADKDGLDAISITDHLEYQPHEKDIPNPDRNRSYNVAVEQAESYGVKDLVIINGAELTRQMPPGHSNAIFLKDANKLLIDDPIDVFKEAKNQGAFVFWNHPHWVSQRRDGVATLTDMHRQLLKEGLLNGIEIVNHNSYSDEALQIAIDYNLTILGTSDIHDLIDWQYKVSEGGHRPVTLVFAKEKTKYGIKEGLFNHRTVVWFNNTLVGSPQYLIPLIKQSLEVKNVEVFYDESDRKKEPKTVLPVEIVNHSDANFSLINKSNYTFHNFADMFTIDAHSKIILKVKTLKEISDFDLKFKVLNGVTAPNEHPEVTFNVKINVVEKSE
jgi:3',5'-nucleoside bisphosphate phosphatase